MGNEETKMKTTKDKNGGVIETQVLLNVYDLTPLNQYTYWFGFGIFHSGIEGLFSKPNGALLKGGAIVAGGTLALSIASSVTVKAIQSVTEAKRRSLGKPCLGCRGKGFYICKLCNGNGTIQWSPLYDPIHINPCQCPTCDNHRIQRCLNCLGKGYY